MTLDAHGTEQPLLTRAEVRSVDRVLIEAGVPGVVLMENAGRGAAEIIAAGAYDGGSKRVVLMAGPGNNGGDAYVVARHLLSLAPLAAVCVVALGDPKAMRGDAAVMRDAWLAVGGSVVRADEAPGDAIERLLDGADVVVDGLFGTGLDRPLVGAALDLVRAANTRGPRLIYALDLPSGLDADTGAPLGDEDGVIHAHRTLTFAASKPGLHTGAGRRLAGVVSVVGLGAPIPPSLLDVSTRLLGQRRLLPRAIDAHKGTAGHVLVVGGSDGKTGAALLAARGAHRGGAGLVTVASRAASIDARVLETMTCHLPSDVADWSAVLDVALQRATATVIGPGLGTDAWAEAMVDRVTASATHPVVVDADALKLPATLWANGRPVRRALLVLTPHPLEMATLLGVQGGAAEVNRDRLGTARTAAVRFGAIVVLKGAGTVVADPQGRAWISPHASAALAVAGSGDVLAGVMGARLAERNGAPIEAVLDAVEAHGRAGQMLEKQRGAVRGALAQEIADCVSSALEGP